MFRHLPECVELYRSPRRRAVGQTKLHPGDLKCGVARICVENEEDAVNIRHLCSDALNSEVCRNWERSVREGWRKKSDVFKETSSVQFRLSSASVRVERGFAIGCKGCNSNKERCSYWHRCAQNQFKYRTTDAWLICGARIWNHKNVPPNEGKCFVPTYVWQCAVSGAEKPRVSLYLMRGGRTDSVLTICHMRNIIKQDWGEISRRNST